MKKIAKIMLCCVVVALMPQACHMNAVSNTIDEIPECAMDFLMRNYPDKCDDIEVLADYWNHHQEEIFAEMEQEQIFNEYHNL